MLEGRSDPFNRKGSGMEPLFIGIYLATASIYAFAHSWASLGWRRTSLLLALTFGISLFFESVGVATGAIYGTYQYADRLGPSFMGLVPYVVPLAWFMMVYPSLIIALRTAPRRGSSAARVMLVAGTGALAMTAWDLALDPVMAHFGFWEWQGEGAYFGIPLRNFLGWWLTSFCIFGAFLLIGRLPVLEPGVWERDFHRLAVISYCITGATTALVALNFGLVGPAVVGTLAMLPWAILGWRGN